jgi:hypothetical protein
MNFICAGTNSIFCISMSIAQGVPGAVHRGRDGTQLPAPLLAALRSSRQRPRSLSTHSALPFDAFGRGEQMTGRQRCTRSGTDPPQGPQRQGPAPDSPGAGARLSSSRGAHSGLPCVPAWRDGRIGCSSGWRRTFKSHRRLKSASYLRNHTVTCLPTSTMHTASEERH